MKKIFVVVLLLVLCCGLACCRHHTTVTPPATMARVTFVVPATYEGAETPAAVEVEVGTAAGALAIPQGAAAGDEYHRLCWYYDQQCTALYDADAVVEHDITLHLGEVGKTYTITYVKGNSATYQGKFVYEYRYGQSPIALPKVVGTGYHDAWYCRELDTLCLYVPTTAGQNITLVAPFALSLPVPYRLGLGDNTLTVTNPNPATIAVDDPDIELQPLSCEGKQFDYWALRLTHGTVTTWNGTKYYEGQRVTTISYAMVKSGQFAFEAIWQK